MEDSGILLGSSKDDFIDKDVFDQFIRSVIANGNLT